MATTYQVELERDESGWWVASVPRVPGAHTQGRSIEQAMNRIREALALWVRDADQAELRPLVHLPAAARATVNRALGARERAERAQEEAAGILGKSIADLTQGEDLSVRDVAALLQISPARVGQLKQSKTTSHRGGLVEPGTRRRTAGRETALRRSTAKRKTTAKKR